MTIKFGKFGNFAHFIVRNFVVIWEAPKSAGGLDLKSLALWASKSSMVLRTTLNCTQARNFDLAELRWAKSPI